MFLLLPLCLALRPSHRSPVIFVITTEVANHTEFRGTSIRTDGEWKFGHVPDSMQARLHAVFPMATVLSVNTDNEDENFIKISEWIHRECLTIQRRVHGDCFVLSSAKTYPPFKTATDPYEFRRWESSLKKVVRHSLEPLDIKPLGSARPTFAVTPSPVVPDSCEDRSQLDCRGEPCRWYGMYHGCRTGAFCGFATKLACEHQKGCEFVRNRCRVA